MALDYGFDVAAGSDAGAGLDLEDVASDVSLNNSLINLSRSEGDLVDIGLI